jgi:predicted metal-dependent phosphoesterase TrpH
MLEAARRCSIKTLAFTDHDSVMSPDTLEMLWGTKSDTNWISGIEITSGLPRELGGGVYSSLHVTGLFVDPLNRGLIEHCQKAQNARIERMEGIVKNLRRLGFDISVDDCLRASGGEAVGRPHIVEALRQRPRNLEIISKIKEDMELAAQKDEELRKKYELLLQRGEAQYPYGLFLTETSFIPDVYVEFQYWSDLEKSVSLVRDAGGVALIAHYFTAKSKIPFEMLEKFLKDKVVDGAETVYGIHAWGTDEWATLDRERKMVRELVHRYDCYEGGGADAHSYEDLQYFSRVNEVSSETEGFAERIIAKGNVAVEFSSFA